MINEITQPTRNVPPMTPAQINSTRKCSSLIRCWASAKGAASAIEAAPASKVRTRYCTLLIVVFAYPLASLGRTMSLGSDTVTGPTRAM